MASKTEFPGPAAQHAFTLGMVVATLAALSGIGLLYWSGHLSALLVGYVLLAGLPVYLVFAASALSVWLGFDKDTTDLRPVYQNRREL